MFIEQSHNSGKPRTKRTIMIEGAILHQTEDNPIYISTREIARNQRINHVSYENFKGEQIVPVSLATCTRINVQRFLSKIDIFDLDATNVQPKFHSDESYSFIDEAIFTRSGLFNARNKHTWAEENPQCTMQDKYQREFSVNMWLGVLDNKLIGPFFLSVCLTREIYLEFLKTILP